MSFSASGNVNNQVMGQDFFRRAFFDSE